MSLARWRARCLVTLSEVAIEKYLAPWQGTDGQQRWVDQVVAVDHSDTREAVARLGDIAVGTIVAWGEHDSWLRPEVGDRLAAAIPAASRVSIPEAGHFVAEDNPAAVARALEPLLAQ